MTARAPRPYHPSAMPHAHVTEIRIDDLHKSFNDHVVLSGVSLEVDRGDLTAIVGGSGCGKTVLLRHILRQLQPDRGRVLIADHERADHGLVDIANLTEEEMDRLRTHWAVVFQRNALFSGTVFENIALWFREVKGMADADIEPIAVAALESVGFKDMQSLLVKDRDELSGGMAKRVAVARAMSMDPILMFYDEPTTGLDPTHAAQIHRLIHETHQRPTGRGIPRTTVIITHDKDLLHRLQPRIIMLHEGRVFFDGTYGQFEQSESEIIRPYFDLMPILNQRPIPA